jgi:phosphopantetheinyl transferase (holo-ACP synthase)
VLHQFYKSARIKETQPNTFADLFSFAELRYIEGLESPAGSISARLLAKSLILEFLHSRNCSLLESEIEILPENYDNTGQNLSGPPCITFLQNVENLSEVLFHLSLSHCESNASAYLIIEEP